MPSCQTGENKWPLPGPLPLRFELPLVSLRHCYLGAHFCRRRLSKPVTMTSALGMRPALSSGEATVLSFTAWKRSAECRRRFLSGRASWSKRTRPLKYHVMPCSPSSLTTTPISFSRSSTSQFGCFLFASSGVVCRFPNIRSTTSYCVSLFSLFGPHCSKDKHRCFFCSCMEQHFSL